MNIRKDDTVIVISGKDKGKKGKVLVANPKDGKIVVEGVSVAKRHQKARRQDEESAIVKVETPIYASKVQVVCPKCGKATRVGHKIAPVTISTRLQATRKSVSAKSAAQSCKREDTLLCLDLKPCIRRKSLPLL